jgi:hypothetical protein
MTLQGDAEPFVCTYGVALDPGAAAPDVNAIANQLRTNWATNINPLMPSIITQLQTEVHAKFSGSPDLVVGVSATTTTGAGSSTALVPQNCAHLIHKRSNAGGRAGRGRMYLPAVIEANVDAVGALTSAWMGTVNSALTALLAGTDGTLTDGMVILHDSHGAAAAASPYKVTALSCDPIIATQRRRLRR